MCSSAASASLAHPSRTANAPEILTLPWQWHFPTQMPMYPSLSGGWPAASLSVPSGPALLTLTGDVQAEVHAIDEVHVQSPRFHEHATVTGGLPATPRVGSFVFWPQVCLSLHNAPTEFCSISKSPDKDLWAVILLRVMGANPPGQSPLRPLLNSRYTRHPGPDGPSYLASPFCLLGFLLRT